MENIDSAGDETTNLSSDKEKSPVVPSRRVPLWPPYEFPLSMVALYSDQPVRARVRVKSESKVCCIFKYIKDHVISNVSPVTE